MRDTAIPTLKKYTGSYYTCTFSTASGDVSYVGLERTNTNADVDLSHADINSAQKVTDEITAHVTAGAYDGARRLMSEDL